MSAVNDFADLLESFGPLKPLKAEAYPTTLVVSIKCLAASFDGLVVDYGSNYSPRFAARVSKRTDTGHSIVWSLPCRSQSQAQRDAEDACRSFAANNAYAS